MTTTAVRTTIPESQVGPAERLLDLVLGASAHLWHHRPGLDVNGRWVARRARGLRRHPGARPVAPGLFAPAAVELYGRLLEIYGLNPTLMAHFASYALLETEWRDLKVACAALMLVQPRAGQPVRDDDGAVAFLEDDLRAIGEAMILQYRKDSKRMLTPKAVLRVAELLELAQIAALNREAGFASPSGRKAALGRWRSAARQWLALREANPPLLEGLVKAGYKGTIVKLARKAGYRPQSAAFFERLGWAQKQAAGGHRRVGLEGLKLLKRARFDGLDEAAICARIVAERLSYKEVVGRLPAEVGLTPAILAALLPSLSDRDLRQLTPTLEALGLLEDGAIRARWERAVAAATDQRALNIAKNVRGRAVREALEAAADAAARQAVRAASGEAEVHVMFLVDISGSMEGAIEASKEALARILAGFAPERLHAAAFDTIGTVLRPKAPTRQAVQHLLGGLRAGGGTQHTAAVQALHRGGVRIGPAAKLIVIVAGDEAGEDGATLASAFRELGYRVDAMALIDCSRHWPRGTTVRRCAAELQVPFVDVRVEQFEDPYQVPRVLRTILEAPVATGFGRQAAWLEKVLATPLLDKHAAWGA